MEGYAAAFLPPTDFFATLFSRGAGRARDWLPVADSFWLVVSGTLEGYAASLLPPTDFFATFFARGGGRGTGEGDKFVSLSTEEGDSGGEGGAT